LLTGERESNIPFSTHLSEKELLDTTVGRFLVSLRFDQWDKLDQLGIEIGSFE